MTIRTRILRPLAVVGLTAAIGWTGLGFAQTSQASAASGSAAMETESFASISATKADSVISIGRRYLGTPYKFGSRSGVTSTFDCSSFTQYVYKKVGISLPRESRDQAKVGSYVSKSNLRKGDLVFFSTSKSGGKIAHVGIYAGNGQILHTYGAGGVKYSSLNSSWWSSHYITARRVL
ncbi:Murein DD-endopeptidase MepS/Murein LD-carboxypeptidase precursor [compost metagenome]